MRDVLVTAAVCVVVFMTLKMPHLGVLGWSWLSYMNPHRLTWGFAYTAPFAQIVALATILALVFSSEKKKFPMNLTTGVWLLFIVWMLITTLLAIYPDAAMDQYIKVIKIQLVTFLTFVLINTRERVRQLIWVISMSIGYFSIKGGVFTIMTGGGFRVYGPPGSEIAENNALALATLMIIPLMFYLRSTSKNIWVRRFLLAAMVLSLASAVGSQSRGALLALMAVVGYFWWQSKSKAITGILLSFILVIGFFFMPASWHDRMSTISNYEEDQSAMARIQAWQYSINIANDRLFGGGFNSWSKHTYEIYRPGYIGVFVAHSIYFNVLADHGWIGLLLFLLILLLTWRNLGVIIKYATRVHPDPEFEVLARALKVSVVAYLAGGAFLSLSYFDLPWHIIAIPAIVRYQLLINGQSNGPLKDNRS